MTAKEIEDVLAMGVAEFTLGDFAEFLTQDEIAQLASDEYALGKLRDRFLDAADWHDSARGGRRCMARGMSGGRRGVTKAAQPTPSLPD